MQMEVYEVGMTDRQYKDVVQRYLNDIKELNEYHEKKDSEAYEKKYKRMTEELTAALNR